MVNNFFEIVRILWNFRNDSEIPCQYQDDEVDRGSRQCASGCVKVVESGERSALLEDFLELLILAKEWCIRNVALIHQMKALKEDLKWLDEVGEGNL